MARTTFTIVLICAVMNFICGCTSMKAVTVANNELAVIPNDAIILSATLNDGQVIMYRSEGARYKEIYLNRSNVIVEFTKEDSAKVIAISDVRDVTIGKSEANTVGTILMVVGAAFLVVEIVHDQMAFHGRPRLAP